MSLTVSYGLLLSLTICCSSMELIHFSLCLLCLLAVSHCLSQCHGISTCLSLARMVAGYLSLSFSVP